MTSPPEGSPENRSGKSAQEIRQRLAALRRDNEDTPTPDAGASATLGDDQWLVIASYRTRDEADGLSKELHERGVVAQVRRTRGMHEVRVRFRDRDVAHEAAQQFKSQQADRRPRHRARRHDFLILGCVLGGVATMLVSLGLVQSGAEAALLLAIVASFAAAGYLVDQVLSRRRHAQSAKLTWTECALLALLIISAVTCVIYGTSVAQQRWSKWLSLDSRLPANTPQSTPLE